MKSSSGSIPHPSKIAPFSIPPIIHDLIEFVEEYGNIYYKKKQRWFNSVAINFRYLIELKFFAFNNLIIIGVQTEGIFRINGRSEDIAAIKKHYKKGKILSHKKSVQICSVMLFKSIFIHLLLFRQESRSFFLFHSYYCWLIEGKSYSVGAKIFSLSIKY